MWERNDQWHGSRLTKCDQTTTLVFIWNTTFILLYKCTPVMWDCKKKRGGGKPKGIRRSNKRWIVNHSLCTGIDFNETVHTLLNMHSREHGVETPVLQNQKFRVKGSLIVLFADTKICSYVPEVCDSLARAACNPSILFSIWKGVCWKRRFAQRVRGKANEIEREGESIVFRQRSGV